MAIQRKTNAVTYSKAGAVTTGEATGQTLANNSWEAKLNVKIPRNADEKKAVFGALGSTGREALIPNTNLAQSIKRQQSRAEGTDQVTKIKPVSNNPLHGIAMLRIKDELAARLENASQGNPEFAKASAASLAHVEAAGKAIDLHQKSHQGGDAGTALSALHLAAGHLNSAVSMMPKNSDVLQDSWTNGGTPWKTPKEDDPVAHEDFVSVTPAQVRADLEGIVSAYHKHLKSVLGDEPGGALRPTPFTEEGPFVTNAPVEKRTAVLEKTSADRAVQQRQRDDEFARIAKLALQEQKSKLSGKGKKDVVIERGEREVSPEKLAITERHQAALSRPVDSPIDRPIDTPLIKPGVSRPQGVDWRGHQRLVRKVYAHFMANATPFSGSLKDDYFDSQAYHDPYGYAEQNGLRRGAGKAPARALDEQSQKDLEKASSTSRSRGGTAQEAAETLAKVESEPETIAANKRAKAEKEAEPEEFATAGDVIEDRLSRRFPADTEPMGAHYARMLAEQQAFRKEHKERLKTDPEYAAKFARKIQFTQGQAK